MPKEIPRNEDPEQLERDPRAQLVPSCASMGMCEEGDLELPLLFLLLWLWMEWCGCSFRCGFCAARQVPFPASPGSGPRPAPLGSRRVQGPGGCGGGRTWGWPGGERRELPTPDLSAGRNGCPDLGEKRELGPSWTWGDQEVMDG